MLLSDRLVARILPVIKVEITDQENIERLRQYRLKEIAKGNA